MNYNFPEHISGDTWSGINSMIISETNTPVNLSNCKIVMQVRSSHNLASPLVYEFSTLKNTILIISAVGGVINVPSQDINIPPGLYNYDLKIIFPNGNKKTYLTGEWKILPNITR